MKKLILGLILSFLLYSYCHAGLVETYLNYDTNSEVNSSNLNGNFSNIRSVLNGGLDNANVDTTSGFRLYEVLGTLPAVGAQGRIVYYTVENSLNFDTGSQWVKAITITTPTQGDIVYYNGTQWVVLNAGTSGALLKTQGAGANPAWLSNIPATNFNSGTGASSSTWLRGDITWVAPTGLSNVIFCWFGLDAAVTNQQLMYEGTSLTPDISATTLRYEYYAFRGVSVVTWITAPFVKIAGISTVTIHAKLWAYSTGASAETILKVDIGGQNNTVKSVTSSTPTWVTTSTIDVSSLTNGTVYTITISLYNESAGAPNDNSYCSGVVLTAS